MGQFSWFTQDTGHRIINGEPHDIYMTDNKGRKWLEPCYGGYGEFGGKDYYECMAEMNGYTLDDFGGDHDALRSKGIELAFADGHADGLNPNVLHPSLTESGEYMGGTPPEPDPDQGWVVEEYEDGEEVDDDW